MFRIKEGIGLFFFLLFDGTKKKKPNIYLIRQTLIFEII